MQQGSKSESYTQILHAQMISRGRLQSKFRYKSDNPDNGLHYCILTIQSEQNEICFVTNEAFESKQKAKQAAAKIACINFGVIPAPLLEDVKVDEDPEPVKKLSKAQQKKKKKDKKKKGKQLQAQGDDSSGDDLDPLAHLNSKLEKAKQKYSELKKGLTEQLNNLQAQFEAKSTEGQELARLLETAYQENDAKDALVIALEAQLEEKSKRIEELNAQQQLAEKENVLKVFDKQLNKEAIRNMEREQLSVLQSSLEKTMQTIFEVKREHAEERERELLCCICMDCPKKVLVMPCKHLCICESCAQQTLDYCPMCRIQVETTMTVFS